MPKKFQKIALFFFAVCFGFFAQRQINAGIGSNVYGQAWSSTIGWVSFNNISLGEIPGGGGTISYGTNIDFSTGLVTGSAWSSNIGWISFDAASLISCPISPCEARLDTSTGQFSGWARVCSVFASGCSGALASDSLRGGWDGFIRLSGANYGVILDNSSNPSKCQGVAWGNNVVGWLSFVCENSGICVNGYETAVSYNNPPYPIPSGVVLSSCPAEMNFQWVYNDDEGDPQTWYEIQISENPGFSPIVLDISSEQAVSSGTITNSYWLEIIDQGGLPSPSELPANHNYYWQIRVQDNQGNWSPWVNGGTFETPINKDPLIDFSWSPGNPIFDEEIDFSNSTIFYDGMPDENHTYMWLFQGGLNTDPNCNFINDADEYCFAGGTDNYSKNPQVFFHRASSSGNSVTFDAVFGDSNGRSCQIVKTLDLSENKLPLPKWEETIPFSP